MSNNITLAVLEQQIENLNRMTGRITRDNKEIKGASVYQLDRCNGGNQLVLRHADTSESNISMRLSKRDLSRHISLIINVLMREV